MYSLLMRTGAATLLIFVAVCSDYSSAPVVPPLPDAAGRLAPELIVSDPIPLEFAGNESVDVAYVSVSPATLSNVRTAAIWSSRLRSNVKEVTISDGGFDPQPLYAHVGDTIRLQLTSAAGVETTLFNIVPRARAPSVVRTLPRSAQEDVPLDAHILVVFSEPIIDNSTDSPIELRMGNTVVETSVESGAGLRLELWPVKPLESATRYEIHARPTITDVSGQRLESELTSAFTTRKPIGPNPHLDPFIGTWQANKWEFFANSEFNGLIEEMISNGLAGTLYIVRRDSASFNWEWRETYRWWGPDYPTIFRGWASVHNSVVRATVEVAESHFECDWGDCDGPLHGEHHFSFVNADELVLSRRSPVNYYKMAGPYAAYSRITLTK